MYRSYSCSIIIFLFIAFLFVPVFVNAQELTPSVTNNQPENTKAIQFHIIGGLAASYCSQLYEYSYLRYTIDLSVSSNTSNGDGNQSSSSTPSSGALSSSSQNINRSSINKRYSVDFVASYIYLLTSKKEIRPFLGFGIIGSYGKSTYNTTGNTSGTMSTSSVYSESEQNSSTWGIGLQGTIGCETFIASNVSMLAEYQISVFRNSTNDDYFTKSTSSAYIDEYTNNSSSNGWQITLQSIRLGIALHF